jgi:hypothetical protein
MRVLEAGRQLLIFERQDARERLRCTFNLSASPASFVAGGMELLSSGQIGEGALGPYAAVIEEIA